MKKFLLLTILALATGDSTGAKFYNLNKDVLQIRQVAYTYDRGRPYYYKYGTVRFHLAGKHGIRIMPENSKGFVLNTKLDTDELNWILMNIHRLIDDLTFDEGIMHEVYLDSLGFKTLGIGHLISKKDPQWIQDLKVGDKVPEAITYSYFLKDLSEALADAHDVIGPEYWRSLPADAKEVFANMAFNLGKSGLSSFRNTLRHARNHDWEKTAAGMKKSLWARQVKSRATRLIARIEGLNEQI